VRNKYDSCVYIFKRDEKFILYLLQYVYGILMTRNEEFGMLKENLNGDFEMKGFGVVDVIPGMDIARNRNMCELFLSQYCYMKEMV